MWSLIFNIAWTILVVVVITWLLIVVATWLVGLFQRPPAEGMPCPNCGYDCRVFDRRQKSHRCPECGVELRWGQLM